MWCFIVAFASGANLVPLVSENTVVTSENSTHIATISKALLGAPYALLQSTAPIENALSDTVEAAASSVAWGLDQIDQRWRRRDHREPQFAQSGVGVSVYVLDTGINCSATRASMCSMDLHVSNLLGNTDVSECSCDLHGHGTLMTTIAASVAPNATYVGIQALESSGVAPLSRILLAMDRVLTLDASKQSGAPASVVLMSLSTDPLNDPSGGVSGLVLTAVASLREHGLVVVVSAGNNNADACLVVPAAAPTALTCAAATKTLERLSSSNYGSCASLFSPGTHNGAAGTSVSAAYTAGGSALYSESLKGAAWQVSDAVARNSTQTHIGNAKGTPEQLLYCPRSAVGEPAILPKHETMGNTRMATLGILAASVIDLLS